MNDPYKIVFKDGQWLCNQSEIDEMLADSGSDSEEDVVLNPNLVYLSGDNISSESEDDEQHDNQPGNTPLNEWYRDFFTPQSLASIPENNIAETINVKSPMEYFARYFSEQHYIDAANNTNIYHLQKHGSELKTSAHEIKKLYGVFLTMGCIPYPRLEMYWRIGLKFPMVASAVSKTRFKYLRSSLHYIDVNETTADPSNLFWKLNPLINAVRDRCRAIPKKVGKYSIDEQMIPYTGRCPARQYVKNKPRPVGLKNFVISTSGGLVVDFEIYQGDKTNLGDRSLGLGPAVVLRLVENLPKGSFVYFDRYFTTVPLLKRLLEMNYRATGTIMSNRLNKVPFKADRHMKRGDSEEFILNDGIKKITAVKWKDTKGVTCISTISGTNPLTTVNRWIKNSKSFEKFPCPTIVADYNQNMGGVDIVDQMMEYYRTFIKTKKWTLKATNHFIDLAVVNSWMEYRQDCLTCRVPKKKCLDLLLFKLELADALIANTRQPRRESSDDEEEATKQPTTSSYSPLPSIGKRYDGYDHLPAWDALSSARCCRLEKCKSRTRCRCEKCNVYLCSSALNNCFKEFHTFKK